MSHPAGAVLHPAQEAYLDRLLPPRDALLQEMERISEEEGIPSSSPAVGRLLQALAGAVKARRILEVGTGIGYGALCMARGAPEAEVHTVDTDRDRLERAKEFLARGQVGDRVKLLHGPALEVLPDLRGPFELAYLDAIKKEYRHYLDLVVPLLALGGVVVIDNLLWKGKVAQLPEGEEEDEQTRVLRAFNPYFMIYPQLTTVLLPLGDGVGLGTKNKPTVREMGGPF